MTIAEEIEKLQTEVRLLRAEKLTIVEKINEKLIKIIEIGSQGRKHHKM